MDRLYSTPGRWNLCRCMDCDLVWLNPRPSTEDLHNCYAEYYTHTSRKEAQATFLGRIWKRVERTILHGRMGYSQHKRHVESMTGHALSRLPLLYDCAAGSVMWLEHSERGRLLDVGSGNGAFLNRMRGLGWDVKGVEPDPVAAQVAQEIFGLDVHLGTLEEARFPSCAFDIVTLHHVIEHVSDPIMLMRECKRVLCPGGRIVIITPNVKGLGSRLFESGWYHLDPPRHLLLFSAGALTRCVESAGLQVETVRTTARGARTAWHNSRKIREDGRLPANCAIIYSAPIRIEGFLFWIIEGMLHRVWNLGEELLLFARKYH